jgi:hypothetical protein
MLHFLDIVHLNFWLNEHNPLDRPSFRLDRKEGVYLGL